MVNLKKKSMTQEKWLSYALVLVLCGTQVSCNASPPDHPKPAGEKRAAGQQGTVDQQPVQEKEKKSKIIRTRDLVEYRNHFRQLGLAYVTFEVEHGKPPAKKEDLRPYLQGATKLLDMLDKEDI